MVCLTKNKKFPQRAKTFFILLRARIYNRIFGARNFLSEVRGHPGKAKGELLPFCLCPWTQ